MSTIKRYRFAISILLLDLVILALKPDLGSTILKTTGANLIQMAQILPAVFLLLGLLDIWVPRQTVIAMLGNKSGLFGTTLSIVLGAAAAGPLYAAFPIASTMLMKGASVSNVFVFLGAWATMKIPMVAFEVSSLGPKFALTRWVMNLIGIVLIATIIERSLTPKETEDIYERQKALQQAPKPGQNQAPGQMMKPNMAAR